MQNQFLNSSSLFVIIVTLLLHGCGTSEDTRPARTAISGVVTYKGSPVAEAIVVFRPSGAEGKTANGRTGADGVFKMGTFEGDDGVVAGEYTVMITKKESAASSKSLPEDDPNYDPDPKEPAPPKDLLPKKYSDTKTSELTVSVTEGNEVTDLNFQLSD